MQAQLLDAAAGIGAPHLMVALAFAAAGSAAAALTMGRHRLG